MHIGRWSTIATVCHFVTSNGYCVNCSVSQWCTSTQIQNKNLFFFCYFDVIREIIKSQQFLWRLCTCVDLVCMFWCINTENGLHSFVGVLLVVLEMRFDAPFAKRENESGYIKSFTLHKIHLKCPNVFIESRAWFINESIDTFGST